MKKILVCILFILGLLSVESKAQKVAVKSNLLYDATTTMNLGLEVALARIPADGCSCGAPAGKSRVNRLSIT